MRGALRIFATLAAVMSLVLGVCSAVLWVRSHYKIQTRGRTRYSQQKGEMSSWVISSDSGRIYVDRWRMRFKPEAVAFAREERGAWSLFVPPAGILTVPSDGMVLAEPQARRWWEKATGVIVEHEEYPIPAPLPAWSSTVAVMVPYWVLVVLFSIGPAALGMRWWKKSRRFAQGRCQHCGYDLRASPERCPECGAVTVGEVA